MNIQEQEERDFNYSTESEWDRADAMDRGFNNKDQEWVLTDRDVWHLNPYYEGEPGPHPYDDEHYGDEGDVYCNMSEDEVRELVSSGDYFDSARIAICEDSI